MNRLFSFDVVPSDRDAEYFGKAWCGPAQYTRGEEVLIAKYDGEADGQPVEVYAEAMPGLSYRVVALQSKDGIGGEIPRATLSTGGGVVDGVTVGQIVAKIAKALSEGMLRIGE